MFKLNFALIALVFLTACNSQKSPEEVLQKYINLRIDHNQSRDALTPYLTGEMLKGVLALSEEDYDKFSKNTNIKKKRFKINLKRCNDQKCYLTYTFKYTGPRKGNDDYIMSVKKIAEVVKVEDKWKISKVSDLKSHLESLKAIEVK